MVLDLISIVLTSPEVSTSIKYYIIKTKNLCYRIFLGLKLLLLDFVNV